MKTRKAILIELGKRIFDELEDEIFDVDDEMQVVFSFDIEGVTNITAFKTSCEEIDLDDEFDEDE